MTLSLAVLWLHVLGVVVWIGAVAHQTHVLLPMARRGDARAFAEAARRGRPVTWTAVAAVVLTGFYNVTRLGPLERVLDSGAGLLLAGKFILVIAAVAAAGHRDFAQVPRLDRALAGGDNPGAALAAIGRLDHVVLALAVVIIYLGLAVARA